MAENPKNLRNGRKEIQIKDQSGTWSYKRQEMVSYQEKGKKQRTIPINEFLGERKRGVGHVSRSLEKEVLETVMENSYRKAERISGKKLKKETIRTRLIKKGEQAKKLEKTKKETKGLQEKEVRDAGSEKDSYKKNRGGRIRQAFGSILGWNRLYLMVDGVGVQAQDKKGQWIGSKECKVGGVIHQSGEKLREVACFCTWERVTGFRNFVEWTLLGVIGMVGLFSEVVIVSDGAKWIRKMRIKIACLFGAIWILDWFHVKDRIEKCLRTLEIQENGELGQKIKRLIWFGKLKEAIEKINQIQITGEETEKEQKEVARKTLLKYLENQKEGIVNYHQMQMQGYLIGSGFIEKRNDTLVKNRMVRQKRMRWGRPGGEAMMQLLTAHMNGRFDDLFV